MGMPVMLTCISAVSTAELEKMHGCFPATRRIKNAPSLNSLDICNSKHPGVCSCAYVHMHVCVHMRVYMWVEARGRHWMSSSIVLHNSLTQH